MKKQNTKQQREYPNINIWEKIFIILVFAFLIFLCSLALVYSITQINKFAELDDIFGISFWGIIGLMIIKEGYYPFCKMIDLIHFWNWKKRLR